MKNTDIALRLRMARLHKRWSMEHLSQLTGGYITKQSISKYETGLMQPKEQTLFILARSLDISVDYLKGKGVSIDLPMLRRTCNEVLSTEQTRAIEAQLAFWAEQYLRTERELYMVPHFVNPLKHMDVSDSKSIARAAYALRQAWNCGDGPLPSVLRLMERKGIKILTTKLPKNVLGLCTWADGTHPLVVLDTHKDKHTTERLRFTAAHELGHLLLQMPQTADEKERESLCNTFAAFFMLPPDTLKEELGCTPRTKLYLDELIDLHEVYGLSVAALVHEAWDLQFITREHYDWWFDNLIKANRLEKGWGKCHYQETVGRERRLRAIANDNY